jgi:hypothetical protein
LNEIYSIEFFYLADLISTIEFNEDGELLAVGDKGGRIVVFQREQQVIVIICSFKIKISIFRLKHHHIVMNIMSI